MLTSYLSCVNTIPVSPGLVKSSIPGQSEGPARQSYNGKLVAVNSWATPGETTQAGIRQRTGGECSKLSAGPSQKLIELPLPRGSSCTNLSSPGREFLL